MSRIQVPSEKYDVIIGWDEGMCSLFAQVFAPGDIDAIVDIPEPGNIITSPNVIIDAIRPYADQLQHGVIYRQLTDDWERGGSSEQ